MSTLARLVVDVQGPESTGLLSTGWVSPSAAHHILACHDVNIRRATLGTPLPSENHLRPFTAVAVNCHIFAETVQNEKSKTTRPTTTINKPSGSKAQTGMTRFALGLNVVFIINRNIVMQLRRFGRKLGRIWRWYEPGTDICGLVRQ